MLEARVYITDKDVFITNGDNRIIQSRFVKPEPNCEASDYDLCFLNPLYKDDTNLEPAPHRFYYDERFSHTSLVYPVGTSVLPFRNQNYYIQREQARGEDVSDWARCPPRPEWFPEYGERHPIIQQVKTFTLEDFRRLAGEFPALKRAEERRLLVERMKINEGRNKNLDTLPDYVLAMLNTEPRLRKV